MVVFCGGKVALFLGDPKPRLDGVAINQRAQEPGTKEARAHPCGGDIQSSN